MSFKIKYEITPYYIPTPSKRRSGQKMKEVKFLVAHDTGTPGSTARNNVHYYINSKNEQSASAHIFVDDKEIIECIPLLTSQPEKAWHVLYNKPKDNELFGGDANDIAGGIELCYGGSINPEEAYKKYVWVLAYCCYKFGLNPNKAIVGHMILDPERKTDPENALSKIGKSYKQLLTDVVKEYNDCTQKEGYKEEIHERKVGEVTMEKWQEELGVKAVKALHEKGLINNPEEWVKKLNENVPNWLFFEMLRRVVEKK